jgi:hypothetical protein
VKHFVETGAVDQVGRATEVIDRGLFTERPLGAEHRHAQGRLQRQTGGHDFAPDGGHVLVAQGAAVGGFDVGDDLGHPIRPEEG